MTVNRREQVVSELLTALQTVRPDGPALIAIDGVDGVGKTHLAQELAALADAATRPILNVSIDGVPPTEG